MTPIDRILAAFERHDPGAVRKCLQDGLDPMHMHAGKPLVYSLVDMYLRSPRFAECMRVMADAVPAR